MCIAARACLFRDLYREDQAIQGLFVLYFLKLPRSQAVTETAQSWLLQGFRLPTVLVALLPSSLIAVEDGYTEL